MAPARPQPGRTAGVPIQGGTALTRPAGAPPLAPGAPASPAPAPAQTTPADEGVSTLGPVIDAISANIAKQMVSVVVSHIQTRLGMDNADMATLLYSVAQELSPSAE